MQLMGLKNEAEHILWASKGEWQPFPTATDALSELMGPTTQPSSPAVAVIPIGTLDVFPGYLQGQRQTRFPVALNLLSSREPTVGSFPRLSALQ